MTPFFHSVYQQDECNMEFHRRVLVAFAREQKMFRGKEKDLWLQLGSGKVGLESCSDNGIAMPLSIDEKTPLILFLLVRYKEELNMHAE